MKEFVLIFRRDYKTKSAQPSPDEMQAHLKHWQDWFRSLAAQDTLAWPVQRWEPQGIIVRSGNEFTDGPFAEINQSIGGLIIIKAAGYNEAREIAQGSPVLDLGGTVEIRMAL